jgi:hypothetical protein
MVFLYETEEVWRATEERRLDTCKELQKELRVMAATIWVGNHPTYLL